MGQFISNSLSLDKADGDQQQKNLQYQSKIFVMEAAGEIDHLSFDDFLARLEDLEKLQYLIPEAAAKDQIQTLKMELKFLKTFSKCIARNQNLKDLSASIISDLKHAFWGLFSKCPPPGALSIPVDAMSVLSNALERIEERRLRVIHFYEQVSASSDSYTRMTTDLLLEFINDLTQNLKDLLRCKPDMVVSFKCQIVDLKEDLQFLQNFIGFAEKGCSDQETLKQLLTHTEAVAIDLARLSYTFLAEDMKAEPSLEMNLKLSDLLQKMMPTKSGAREIYIGVLKGSQFPESSGAYTVDKDVLGALVDWVRHYLLVFLNSKSRFMYPLEDQLKILDEKLRFLRILLMYPSREYFDIRSIDAQTIVSDLLLFSLNVDEMTEEMAERMLEKMNRIEELAKQSYLRFSKSARSEFPMTDGLGFIQSFMENLNELLRCRDTSIAFPKHQIETIQKDFESFTSLLRNMETQLHQHKDLESLWTRVIDLAYQTEYVIDSFLVNNGPAWFYMLWLSDVIKEIQIIKAGVIDFNTKMANDTGEDNVEKPSSNALSSQAITPALNERVVGFEDDEKRLIELLKGGSSQLDIVSIVGMAGLGKTTLSKKIFNSELIQKVFHVRGWCSVPEVYWKKDTLTSLLSQISAQKDKEDKVDDDELDEVLCQRLRKRKYLIVLDNIWNIEAWNDLKRSFPDDNNGSRIMFTTRYFDVAIKAKLHSDPHSLRPFHAHESWELLKQLVFPEEICPTKLEEIGEHIAKSCKGVPLSVALIAGILATDKTQDFWNQVSKSLTSRIFDSAEQQTKEIIEKSYRHLPQHLRPCFLYFGAFLQGQEIPVKRLIWLWTAEGFLRKPKEGSIEKSAEDYLKILIDRSLVSISKYKADGGIKKCRVHDLLSHFCKVKSREENFLQFDGFVSDDGVKSPGTPTYERHRLCMYYQEDAFISSRPSGSHVRSLLHNLEYQAFLFVRERCADISCISNSFKLLRVLDLESLYVEVFPDGLEMLVLLKYLALKTGSTDFIPALIGSLRNLEIFVLQVLQNVIVPVLKMFREVIMPETIWKMRKLRHLHIRGGIIFDSDYQRRSEFFSEPNWFTKLFAGPNSPVVLRGQRQASPEEDSDQQMLDSLDTISNLYLFQGEEEKIIRKIPNVRKLRCTFKDSYDNSSNSNHFPNLELLSDLESLHVSNDRESRLLHSGESISFPSKLKKLTLNKFNLPLAVISKIGGLENLEILKLQFFEFEEHRWEMKEGEFPSLKHLELKDIEIEEWNVPYGNFPCLQRLRLLFICNLSKVPSCFASVETLEMIEVKNCPSLDLESVWKIQEEKADYGNEEFKVIVQLQEPETTL